MKIAVLYENDKVLIQWSPDRFKELLRRYLLETESFDEAWDRVIEDIKKETVKL